MTHTIRIEPLGIELHTQDGASLRDLLFPYGVEFPCGGKGTCHRCAVRTSDGKSILACRTEVTQSLSVWIEAWAGAILTDHAPPVSLPSSGRGIAIDLGTTTIVAQLVDGATGSVLGTRAELNEQASFGADVMTRIEYALRPEDRVTLQQRIVMQTGRMVRELTADPLPVVIVGNTAMHHLFGGLDVEPLCRAPFEPQHLRELRLAPDIRFLRPIGGFVGSDILAGIVATGMHESPELNVLLDLGTNGEIVVGNRDRLLCASTAAGPAFEGGRISCGVRASAGAIDGAEVVQGRLVCSMLGAIPRATGVCGSGLVDIAAAALELGLMNASGRVLTETHGIPLRDGLRLGQSDIRELQLAKGAVAGGLQVLLRRLGASTRDIRRLYLAGAFGNYVRSRSALRIGLLPFDDERVVTVGNSSLAGAKLTLFSAFDFDEVLSRTEHVRLHTMQEFDDAYLDCMRFPNLSDLPQASSATT